MTQRWQKGEVSNYQYLMFLNTIAGKVYRFFCVKHLFRCETVRETCELYANCMFVILLQVEHSVI